MTRAAQKRARRQAARERAQAAAVDMRPRWRRWLGSAWSWFFAHLGPGRQRFIARALVVLHRTWAYPAPPPDVIGHAGRYEYRPASIGLDFRLYADGSVVYVNPWGNDEYVTDEHLIGLVHREYRLRVEHARKRFADNPRARNP